MWQDPKSRACDGSICGESLDTRKAQTFVELLDSTTALWAAGAWSLPEQCNLQKQEELQSPDHSFLWKKAKPGLLPLRTASGSASVLPWLAKSVTEPNAHIPKVDSLLARTTLFVPVQKGVPDCDCILWLWQYNTTCNYWNIYRYGSERILALVQPDSCVHLQHQESVQCINSCNVCVCSFPISNSYLHVKRKTYL